MILVDQMLIVNLGTTLLYVLVHQVMLVIHLINGVGVKLNLVQQDPVALMLNALQMGEQQFASAQEDIQVILILTVV
jgi:hypothetical protein